MEQWTDYVTKKEIWIATLPSVARNDGWRFSLQEKRRFETGGPLRFKKNDVLGRADPSASRKMTFRDERTPPLQEKWRFGTSGPLRFKKNDDFRQETFVKWIYLQLFK